MKTFYKSFATGTQDRITEAERVLRDAGIDPAVGWWTVTGVGASPDANGPHHWVVEWVSGDRDAFYDAFEAEYEFRIEYPDGTVEHERSYGREYAFEAITAIEDAVIYWLRGSEEIRLDDPSIFYQKEPLSVTGPTKAFLLAAERRINDDDSDDAPAWDNPFYAKDQS